MTKGYASPEAETAYRRAFVLCQQLSVSPQLFHALRGLSSFHHVRAELSTAWALAERELEVAQRLDDPAALTAAHAKLGNISFWLGLFGTARAHLERSIGLYEPSQQSFPLFVARDDAKVQALSFLSWTLWSLGYPEGALQTGHEVLGYARALAHPYNLTYALGMATRLSHLRSEVRVRQQQLDELEKLARSHGFALWAALSAMWGGWVMTEQGHHIEGIAQFQQGLAAHAATGMMLNQSYNKGVLAAMYGKAGQPAQGLHVIAEAERFVQRSGEQCYAAEISRLKGELLLCQREQVIQHRGNRGSRPPSPDLPGAHGAPEAYFCQAIEIARRQQAKSWECAPP